MKFSELVDERFGSEENREELSPSDEAYLQFRKVVDPGMLRAGFDVIPAKSAAVRSRKTGEPHVDQPIRSHILTGAAFGSRFNAALNRLGLDAAIERDELVRALALFSCHDLHKTDEAQRRRFQNERGLGDEDKDVTAEEVEKYSTALGLGNLEITFGKNPIQEYHASALAAEELSGRHKSAGAPAFRRLRNWVRLMDAAAGLQEPDDVAELSKRVSTISNQVRLDYHRIDDVKGVTTNILNSAIETHLSSKEGVEPIVYFENGVVYAVNREAEPDSIIEQSEIDDGLLIDISNQFIDQANQSRSEFNSPQEIRGQLISSGILPKGYLRANKTAYFLSGHDTVFEAACLSLNDRASNDDWTQYSVYDDGLAAAIADGLVDSPPETHHKVQAAGIFLGMAYSELFLKLNGGDVEQAIRDIANALDCSEVGELLSEEYESDQSIFSADGLDAQTLNLLSQARGESVDDCVTSIQSLDLHSGGNKSFTQTMALSYLSGRMEEPLEILLTEIRDKITQYYQKWQGHWDEHRDDPNWDPEWTEEQKKKRFEKELQGVLPAATRYYIRKVVEINGKWFDQVSEKSKFEHYARSSQGHICLLCNDILIGDTSLDSFETNQDTVGTSLGFTHGKEINATGGEPKAVVCPLCELEMTLRNSVESEDPDQSSQYLLLAPDYFYSPIDMQIAKQIHSHLQPNDDLFFHMARRLIGTNPADRSRAVDEIIDLLERAEEQEDFRKLALNYDTAFRDNGPIGIFRLDAPQRQGTDKEISRMAQWCLSSYFAVVTSWLTGSRVLLTDTPIPAVEPGDFNEMIRIERAAGPVQRFAGETVSVSRLATQDDGEPWKEYRFSHLMKTDGDDRDESVVEGGATNDADPTNTNGQNETTTYEQAINTGLSESLYKLSAFIYVADRVYRDEETNAIELQRLATLLSTVDDPFPGASALLKGDDWLTERAEELYAEHRDDLEVSLTTFVELFLIEEQFPFDREQAAISILEMTDADVDEQIVFQASEYIDDGLNVFDAFHAALAGDRILSSDKEFDDIGIERIQLEPETTTTEMKTETEDE